MQNKLYLSIRIIALIFGLMYLVSGTQFIVFHEIDFINYVPVSHLEIWTVRNLGGRLLAIGVGFLLAFAFNSKHCLVLMFAIRIVADFADLVNSYVTPDIGGHIVPIIAALVVVEVLCFLGLLRLIR